MANIEVKRKVELDGLLRVDALNGVAFTNENAAHKFTITCMRGGQPYALSGTISGRFMRADGTTVNVTGGTITNGVASIVLPRDCYNVVGRFQLAILCTAGSSALCIYAAIGHITRSADGTVIDTGTVFPSADELRDQLEELDRLLTDADAYGTRLDTAESAVASSAKDIRVLQNRVGFAVVRTNNLYNYVTNTKNLQLYTSGQEVENSNYETSDYIPVTVGTTYSAAYWAASDGSKVSGQAIPVAVFYDSSKQIIDGSGVGDGAILTTGVTAPTGSAYMRITINKQYTAGAAQFAVVIAGEPADIPSGYVYYWTLSPYIARASALTALTSTVSGISSRVGALETGLGNEVARAQSAEQTLTTAVNTKASASALSDEVARAQGAEMGLAQQIGTVGSSVASLSTFATDRFKTIAPDFSTSTAYAVGDSVYHENKLYRFTTAHPAGAWDSSHVTEATVGASIKRVRDEIAGVFSESTAYTPGDYCYHGDFLVRCRVAHQGSWDDSHFSSITVGDMLEQISAITAPYFSESTAYSVGDYCIREDLTAHELRMYRFTTSHTGAWNISHVTQVTVADELEALNDRPAYTFTDDGEGNITIS